MIDSFSRSGTVWRFVTSALTASSLTEMP